VVPMGQRDGDRTATNLYLAGPEGSGLQPEPGPDVNEDSGNQDRSGPTN